MAASGDKATRGASKAAKGQGGAENPFGKAQAGGIRGTRSEDKKASKTSALAERL